MTTIKDVLTANIASLQTQIASVEQNMATEVAAVEDKYRKQAEHEVQVIRQAGEALVAEATESIRAMKKMLTVYDKNEKALAKIVVK